MSRPRTLKTVAVDFDGVIHTYDKGYQDGSIYGDEIKDAFATIKKLMDADFSVYVLSTRKPKQIYKWLNKEGRLWYHDAFAGPAPFDSDYGDDKAYLHGFKVELVPRRAKFWNKQYVLGVTNKKLPAIAYLDDRAIRFNGDWQQALYDIVGLSK